jgi:hypothetical protein
MYRGVADMRHLESGEEDLKVLVNSSKGQLGEGKEDSAREWRWTFVV